MALKIIVSYDDTDNDRDALALGGTLGELGGDPKAFVFSFPGLLQNVPVLETAAAGRGAGADRAAWAIAHEPARHEFPQPAETKH